MDDERGRTSGRDGDVAQQAPDAELIRRARAAFDADAEALDDTTQRRLTTARRAALAALEAPQVAPRRGAFAQWAPVGAAAAVAVVAVGIALSLRGPEALVPVPETAVPAPAGAEANAPVTEMELLLGEDDPALYDEDPEFYEWAAAEAGVDDAG